jgi:hypothetical protein
MQAAFSDHSSASHSSEKKLNTKRENISAKRNVFPDPFIQVQFER